MSAPLLWARRGAGVGGISVSPRYQRLHPPPPPPSNIHTNAVLIFDVATVRAFLHVIPPRRSRRNPPLAATEDRSGLAVHSHGVSCSAALAFVNAATFCFADSPPSPSWKQSTTKKEIRGCIFIIFPSPPLLELVPPLYLPTPSSNRNGFLLGV